MFDEETSSLDLLANLAYDLRAFVIFFSVLSLANQIKSKIKNVLKSAQGKYITFSRKSSTE